MCRQKLLQQAQCGNSQLRGRQPGALRAGFNFYQAIGGGTSYPHARGRGAAVEESMRRVAIYVRGHIIAECGHFVPEEQPEELIRLLLDFLQSTTS